MRMKVIFVQKFVIYIDSRDIIIFNNRFDRETIEIINIKKIRRKFVEKNMRTTINIKIFL